MSYTAPRGMVLWLTVIVFWAAQVASAVAAQTVDLNPVADAFVSAANPGSNFGAAGGLSIAASGLSKGEFQSLLRFDASTAKTTFDTTFGLGAWSIQGITLRLTAAAPLNPIFNSPNAPGQFAASWMERDDWIEGTGKPNAPTTNGIMFSTLPAFLSANDQSLGVFTYNGSNSGTSTYALTPAAGLLADVAAGNLASLRLLAADASVAYVSNSRDFTTAALRPALSITAVALPEPSSVLLVLAGGGALLLFRSVVIHRRLRWRR